MNNIGARDALVEQIKKSNNILIALNANPTIDELASALGLNLILNKTNAHATTIFSGQTPDVLKFLNPDVVFDQTVDGLRDFIIALDPAKADYVRTKVVDGMVRVSITPSKAAVTVDDLEFSQGDYNVDLVIALGVKNQDDLDNALRAHGRILHNAYVASIGIGSATSDLGNLNWQEPALQSYAQIVADLTLSLEPRKEDDKPSDGVIIDSAVATALMTALVAVTDRFSNVSTTPEVMSLAAVLMEQGADQQLISAELDAPKKLAEAAQSVPTETASESVEGPAFEQATKIDHAEAEPVVEAEKQPVTTFEVKTESVSQPETNIQVVVSDAKPEAVAQTISQGADNSEILQNDTLNKINQIIDQIADTDKDLLSQPSVNTQKLEIANNSTDGSLLNAEVAADVAAEALHEQKNDSESVNQKLPQDSNNKPESKQSQDTANPSEQGTKPDNDEQSTTPSEQTRSLEPKVVEKPASTAPVPSADEPELVLPEVKMPPRKVPKDSESWDKVNKFKQAFANRLEKTKEQLNDQNNASTKTTPDLVKPNEQLNNESANNKKSAKEPVEKGHLKRKPVKVIQPLEHEPEVGPTVSERIDQELNKPTMPPMPQMPIDIPMPPMPPMPPEFDPMTMTSVPPVGQPDFANSPFNQLEQPMPSQPAPQSVPFPQPQQQPIPQPTPQPQQSQPAPQPVPENQFVIPE